MNNYELERAAKALKQNKLLWLTFDEIHGSIIEDWQQASTAEMRENLWLELNVLTKFREELNERLERFAPSGAPGGDA